MIELQAISYNILMDAGDVPSIMIEVVPAIEITLETTGPQGPRGLPGVTGPAGPAGSLEDVDLPDFTLIFENRLV